MSWLITFVLKNQINKPQRTFHVRFYLLLVRSILCLHTFPTPYRLSWQYDVTVIQNMSNVPIAKRFRCVLHRRPKWNLFYWDKRSPHRWYFFCIGCRHRPQHYYIPHFSLVIMSFSTLISSHNQCFTGSLAFATECLMPVSTIFEYLSSNSFFRCLLLFSFSIKQRRTVFIHVSSLTINITVPST